MKDKIELHLITGKAGVGKSTYSFELANNINATIISIATPIKQLAYAKGWNGEKDIYGRSLLQRLGREGRELHYHIWVNHLLFEIFKKLEIEKTLYNKKVHRFIVPDVRFDDEIEYFVNSIGKDNIKVHRVHREGFKSELSKEQQNDITERGVSDNLVDEEVYL